MGRRAPDFCLSNHRIQSLCFDLELNEEAASYPVLNQRKESKPSQPWLTTSARELVFEDVDEFFCRSTNPSEALANDLGIIRLPRSEVERRPAIVEPAVAPDDVGDCLGLDFAFRPFGVVVNVEVEQGCAYSWISVRARSASLS